MPRRLHRLLMIAVVPLLCSLLFPWSESGRMAATLAAQNNDEVQVRQLLADVGTKNGVTFTIEEALVKGGAMDRIRSFRHRPPPEGTSVKAALDELSQSVPNFAWYNDPNSRIIHILDDRLLRRPGYALDQTIDDIDFSGTVAELVGQIASKGIPVSAGGPVATEDLMFIDFSTTVQVRAKGLKVRDGLSDFVSLAGRGPILWNAETYIDGTDQTTYIRFRGGPARKPTPSQ